MKSYNLACTHTWRCKRQCQTTASVPQPHLDVIDTHAVSLSHQSRLEMYWLSSPQGCFQSWRLPASHPVQPRCIVSSAICTQSHVCGPEHHVGTNQHLSHQVQRKRIARNGICTHAHIQEHLQSLHLLQPHTTQPKSSVRRWI